MKASLNVIVLYSESGMVILIYVCLL